MSDPIDERLGLLERLYRAHGDKVRFLFVGGINTAFGYGVFLAMLAVVRTALTAAGTAGLDTPSLMVDNYYLIAQWASWVLSVPFGAWTLKSFVFRSPGPYLPQMFKAYAVYLPGTLVNSVALWAAVTMLGLTPPIGQLLALTLATVLSYLGHKHFTFKHSAADTPES